MFDEELPMKKKTSEFPKKLDGVSISDLNEYIIELETEIQRVQSDIERKKASQLAADTFFKM